jgi:hypothetical protein
MNGSETSTSGGRPNIRDLGHPKIACYVVTDIETDGPSVGTHSMRSFASAVVLQDGELGDTFAAALHPLPGAAPDPRTLAWFQQHPEAWENATANPEDPGEVMRRYAAWLRQLPSPRIFASHPLTFDGVWIDWYLRRFVGEPLFTSLFDTDPLFFGDGIDLPTFIAGRLRVDYSACVRKAYPPEWFDGHMHTHKAIDDAMGYASVLRHVLRCKQSD